jgi:hypothetical protein
MIVIEGDNETLCCQLCRRPFRSLEEAWLLSPLTGGEGRWVHRRCADGAGPAVGLSEYRLKRGDFALKSVITRLWRQVI